MSLDADAIVDRRKLKRRLIVWRMAAIAAVATLVFVALFPVQDFYVRDHIASLRIAGLITDDHKRLSALDKVARSPQAKALIVSINSPGGTAVGGETLYHALRRVAEEKPVVALIRTVGASGGYMAALAADRICARENSITGSIGVIVQTAEISGLLEKIGIKTEALVSAPLKGEPSAFAPLTDAARQATQELIDDSHNWFVDLLASRRGLSAEDARALADGRIFTGRQALQVRLIDSVGGMREARTWLNQDRGVPTGLPLKELVIEQGATSLLAQLLGSAEKTLLSERLTLDGLLTLWQPEGLF
jgi:protease-4